MEKYLHQWTTGEGDKPLAEDEVFTKRCGEVLARAWYFDSQRSFTSITRILLAKPGGITELWVYVREANIFPIRICGWFNISTYSTYITLTIVIRRTRGIP